MTTVPFLVGWSRLYKIHMKDGISNSAWFDVMMVVVVVVVTIMKGLLSAT